MTPLRFLMSFLMLLFYCKETPSHFMCSNHCDTTIISHSCWDESANFLARGSRNGNDTSKRSYTIRCGTFLLSFSSPRSSLLDGSNKEIYSAALCRFLFSHSCWDESTWRLLLLLSVTFCFMNAFFSFLPHTIVGFSHQTQLFCLQTFESPGSVF